jgi:hypothetical protein
MSTQIEVFVPELGTWVREAIVLPGQRGTISQVLPGHERATVIYDIACEPGNRYTQIRRHEIEEEVDSTHVKVDFSRSQTTTLREDSASMELTLKPEERRMRSMRRRLYRISHIPISEDIASLKMSVPAVFRDAFR